MKKFEILQLEAEMFTNQAYRSSEGGGYYMCKKIFDYMQENPKDDIVLDFENTNPSDDFILDLLCYIIHVFNEELLSRIQITNVSTFVLHTELIKKINTINLYQNTLSKIQSYEMIKNLFK